MPDYYTPDEVAKMFRVKRTTVLSWHRTGRLDATILPGSSVIRFTQAAIDSFTARGAAKTGAVSKQAAS